MHTERGSLSFPEQVTREVQIFAVVSFLDSMEVEGRGDALSELKGSMPAELGQR